MKVRTGREGLFRLCIRVVVEIRDSTSDAAGEQVSRQSCCGVV